MHSLISLVAVQNLKVIPSLELNAKAVTPSLYARTAGVEASPWHSRIYLSAFAHARQLSSRRTIARQATLPSVPATSQAGSAIPQGNLVILQKAGGRLYV
jgi:hypothetical protein